MYYEMSEEYQYGYNQFIVNGEVAIKKEKNNG